MEDPPQADEPFDYDAVPSRFYFEVESIGNLEPDAIIQQGIKVLQQKLAAVIQELDEDAPNPLNGGFDGGYDGPRSPDVGGGGQPWEQPGYTTPFGASSGGGWGGQGQATPYGQGTLFSLFVIAVLGFLGRATRVVLYRTMH